MTGLPAPLVPTEIDLSKLDGFMLDTVKLLGSELVALSTGDEFKAAVMLWCRAWKQRPAASLPDDDRILASFAGYGRDVKGWQKVREMALRGFVQCSDGRLYHQVLAADAVRAFRAREQRAEALRKRYGKATGIETPALPADAREASGAPTETLPETGREETEHRKESKEESEVRSHARATRLPSDFVVSEKWKKDGAETRARHGLPPIDLDLEAANFVDFWAPKPGKDGTKTDWHRTWLRWCRTAKGSFNVRQNRESPDDQRARRRAGFGAALMAQGVGAEPASTGEPVRDRGGDCASGEGADAGVTGTGGSAARGDARALRGAEELGSDRPILPRGGFGYAPGFGPGDAETGTAELQILPQTGGDSGADPGGDGAAEGGAIPAQNGALVLATEDGLDLPDFLRRSA